MTLGIVRLPESEREHREKNIITSRTSLAHAAADVHQGCCHFDRMTSAPDHRRSKPCASWCKAGQTQAFAGASNGNCCPPDDDAAPHVIIHTRANRSVPSWRGISRAVLTSVVLYQTHIHTHSFIDSFTLTQNYTHCHGHDVSL